jgi:hypothetical protein
MEPCPCGYEPTSRSTGKRHRKACPVWNNTDKEAVRKESFQRSMLQKHGVENPMFLEHVKDKLRDTCKSKYGAENVFCHDSSIFQKTQRSNRVQKSESEYWKKRKRKSTRFKLVDFDFAQTTFDILDPGQYGEALDLLNKFHYAKSGRGAKLVFVLKLDESIVAVAKYSSVVRKETATSMGLSDKDVLELDRFCIHPKYQKKNLGSFFLAKTVRHIKTTDVKMLVSFADSGQNHDGALYKASNWEQIGETKSSYEYMDPNMNPINKKTVYNRAVKLGMTESEYVEKNELMKVKTPPKIKFVMRISK